MEYAVLVGVVVIAIGTALQQFQDEVAAAFAKSIAVVSGLPGVTG